jgi:hypothetical protein
MRPENMILFSCVGCVFIVWGIQKKTPTGVRVFSMGTYLQFPDSFTPCPGRWKYIIASSRGQGVFLHTKYK